MFATLRERDFALLWGARVISVLGDWLLVTALPFFVYRMARSALASGLILVAYTAPSVHLGALAGVFVDRWAHRRTMVAADLARAALLLPILLVRSQADLWIVHLVILTQASIVQFFGPAKQAVLPLLVGSEGVVAANSLSSIEDGIARLVGPPRGGVLLGAFGIQSAVVVDSLSFLFSGLLILRIIAPPSQRHRAGQDAAVTAPWRVVWWDLLGGRRLVREDRTLVTLFLVMGVYWFSQGMLGVLIVPFVQQSLGMDAQVYGRFSAIQAIGGLVGGVLVGRLGRNVAPSYLVSLGLGVSGSVLLAKFFASSSADALVWGGLAGLPGVAIAVGAQTLLQTASPERYRGRVIGAYGTTISAPGPAGMGVSGALADHLGAVPLLDARAALYLLASPFALLLTRRVVGSTPATAGD